jgi:Rab GDP dissociation inhibitor
VPVQGFARLAAVHGGTYMLSKPGLEIQYDDAGKFTGVKDDQGDVAKAPLVIGDPSYFPGKTRVTGKVVRAICIMNHAIPNTGDSHSVQIIVPFSQVGRKNDIYVFCSSWRCARASSPAVARSGYD